MWHKRVWMCILNETLNVYKIKICKGRFEKKETICYSPWISKKTRIWLGIAGTPNLGWNVARASLNVRKELLLSWRSTLRGAAACEEWLAGSVALAQKCFWWIVCSSPSLLRRTLHNSLLLVGVRVWGVRQLCTRADWNLWGKTQRKQNAWKELRKS